VSAALQAAPPRAVDVTQIESELQSLWGEPPEGGAPPTRACMSNLIVLCTSGASARRMPDDIAEVVRQHPSRVLLLVAEEGEAAGIEAVVSAQCHLGGEGRQICSEHVTLLAAGSRRRGLPSVARALLIGDLPTALWWTPPDAPVFGGSLFRELVGMADQLVYDSLGWDDPVTGLETTSRWAADGRAGQVMSDLAWRRLEPWRWVIAQALDPAVAPGALGAITEVVVEHGWDAMAEAWLLIAWLGGRLGWEVDSGAAGPEREIEWRLQSNGRSIRAAAVQNGRSESGVRSVCIAMDNAGRKQTCGIAEVAPGRLGIARDGEAGIQRMVSAPRLSRATLLARELARYCDPVFLDTLTVSAMMAERLNR